MMKAFSDFNQNYLEKSNFEEKKSEVVIENKT